MPRTDCNRADPVRFSSSAHICSEAERPGCRPHRAHCGLRHIYRVFWPHHKYVTTEMVRVAQPKNTQASSRFENSLIRQIVNWSNRKSRRNHSKHKIVADLRPFDKLRAGRLRSGKAAPTEESPSSFVCLLHSARCPLKNTASPSYPVPASSSGA
jgi:hypothetical protein